MTAAPDRLTRLARALAVVTTRPPVVMASTALQLRNPLNGGGLSTSRGARMASNRRRQAERLKGRTLALRLATDLHGWKPILDPRVVVLTRVSPKAFDSDNLEAAFKSVRDGMAEAWGINDADPRVMWVTDWRKGKAHAVEAALWVVPEVAKPEDVCRCRNEYETCEVCTRPPLLPPERCKLVSVEQGFDADDYNGRPQREVVVHGGLIQRREVRVTPNVIRAKGGA